MVESDLEFLVFFDFESGFFGEVVEILFIPVVFVFFDVGFVYDSHPGPGFEYGFCDASGSSEENFSVFV